MHKKRSLSKLVTPSVVIAPSFAGELFSLHLVMLLFFRWSADEHPSATPNLFSSLQVGEKLNHQSKMFSCVLGSVHKSRDEEQKGLGVWRESNPILEKATSICVISSRFVLNFRFALVFCGNISDKLLFSFYIFFIW